MSERATATYGYETGMILVYLSIRHATSMFHLTPEEAGSLLDDLTVATEKASAEKEGK